MKFLLTCLLAVVPSFAIADFIHPMEFNGSAQQKNEVIEFIKAQVKKDYCDSGIDMCQPTTLRMMEKENLKAFKQSSQASDRQIMDQVISDYCYSGIDMCNYTTIHMMYQQNLQASQQELTW